MTLKNPALPALIGTILMTALSVWTFILTLLNIRRDLVPAVTVFQSFIYAFGCFSVMVFSSVFPPSAEVLIPTESSFPINDSGVMIRHEADTIGFWMLGRVHVG